MSPGAVSGRYARPAVPLARDQIDEAEPETAVRQRALKCPASRAVRVRFNGFPHATKPTF
eukprot:4968877-Prymnesium_polylepis.1